MYIIECYNYMHFYMCMYYVIRSFNGVCPLDLTYLVSVFMSQMLLPLLPIVFAPLPAKCLLYLEIDQTFQYQQ